jgi:hypothetical protein
VSAATSKTIHYLTHIKLGKKGRNFWLSGLPLPQLQTEESIDGTRPGGARGLVRFPTNPPNLSDICCCTGTVKSSHSSRPSDLLEFGESEKLWLSFAKTLRWLNFKDGTCYTTFFVCY